LNYPGKDNNAGMNEYQLYSAAGKQPLSCWKAVPENVKMTVDKLLKINTVYGYGVRAKSLHTFYLCDQ
jgi:hypothetical protein